ncbi:MAG: c-type cytochrome [Candidatus Bipolaricaulia bacterium]
MQRFGWPSVWVVLTVTVLIGVFSTPLRSIVTGGVLEGPLEQYQAYSVEQAKATTGKFGCIACHQLEGQGRSITLSFEDISRLAPSRAEQLGFASTADFIRQSILDPRAFIEYQAPAIMPTGFGNVMTAAEFENLVKFLTAP